MKIDKKLLFGELEKNKIILIMRGLSRETAAECCEAVYDGGIRFAELPFDALGRISDDETAENLRFLSERFAGALRFGAGTVLSAEQARIAAESGAEYIVSPNTDATVVGETVKLGLLSVPGAVTPTEICEAHRLGADFVKIFPAGNFGPSYFKAVSQPLSHIPLLAVGGIELDAVGEYLSAGAKGFGISTRILRPEYISAGNFAAVRELSSEYVRACIVGGGV